VYVHLKIWNAFKEVFIANVVKMVLANQHLYTWQYVQLPHNVLTNYQNANGLFNDSFSGNETKSGSG
jgi:hypothetical protein